MPYIDRQHHKRAALPWLIFLAQSSLIPSRAIALASWMTSPIKSSPHISSNSSETEHKLFPKLSLLIISKCAVSPAISMKLDEAEVLLPLFKQGKWHPSLSVSAAVKQYFSTPLFMNSTSKFNPLSLENVMASRNSFLPSRAFLWTT